MSSYAPTIPNDSLKGPAILSIVFHAAIFTAVGFATYHSKGDNWGTVGGSMSVGIVGNVPAVPMPAPDVVSENRVVDETKGLYKAEEPPPPIVEKEAVPLPKFDKTKPEPKYKSKPSKLLENPKPPPPNAVPYGRGGAPNVPYSSPSMTMGNGTQGGMSFGAGGGASGDFASRYSWYVQAVQSRVATNWLQSTVDPGIQFAPRAVVTFRILRNGQATNIQVLRSSGNQSVDMSAERAIQEASPLQPLPNDYSGNYVDVEFWFDFKRQ